MQTYKTAKIDDLHNMLTYDAGSGILTWKPRSVEYFCAPKYQKIWNKNFAGKPALNMLSAEGYRVGKIQSISFFAHRVIWAMVYSEWPSDQIDHINGIKSDNRIPNLRIVSNLTNQRNQSLPAHNTSGVMGVTWDKESRKWKAQIRVGPRNYNLGRFADIDDAAAARKAADDRYGFHPNHGRAA